MVLQGWSKRKKKDIIGSTVGDLFNYQMLILRVHKSIGIDLNTGINDTVQDIYVGSSVKDDFSDIRITDLNDNILNYYIISIINGQYADIILKLPLISSYPSTTSIYIYYGNPIANSISNGNNTFIFFDDFTNYSIGSINNQGGWIVRAINGTNGFANVVSYNNKNHMSIVATSNDPTYYPQTNVMHPTTLSNSTRLFARIIYPIIYTYTEGGIIGYTNYDVNINGRSRNAYQRYFFAEDNTQHKLVKWTNNTATVYQVGTEIGNSDTYYNIEISWDNNIVKGYMNKTKISEFTDATFSVFPYIHVATYPCDFSGNPTTPFYVDLIYLRTFTEPEPQWGITYQEEDVGCLTPLCDFSITEI